MHEKRARNQEDSFRALLDAGNDGRDDDECHACQFVHAKCHAEEEERKDDGGNWFERRDDASS